MSIVTLLIVIVIVGTALYVVNTVVPMGESKIRTVLNVVIVLLLCLWLLDALVGIGPSFGRVHR